MRKIIALTLCLIFSILALASCKWFAEPEDKPGEGGLADPQVGMYYTPSGFSDIVFAIDRGHMNQSEFVTITSLQGILAQTQATIYITGDEGQSAERLAELSAKHGFTVETVNDPWTLIDMFYDVYRGTYVLYNDHSNKSTLVTDQTINYAATVSGVEGWLMISKDIELTARNHGLTLGVDATGSDFDTRYVFETYKDRLNNAVLVHQDQTNNALRDYAIAAKAMCFYSDSYDGDSSVKADILNWAKENAPILGWTANEVNFVAANSLQSVVTVAADHCVNLSFYAASGAEELTQDGFAEKKITAEEGKHYVAIVMSDGDNVQWMTRGFENNVKYYGSPYRGKFPMTWTTSPSLYDLAPDILGGMYEDATENDLFIAGPSGVGYINATEYNSDSLAGYAAYTAGYMEKTDLEYINFIDNTINPDVLDAFSAYDQVKGGVWSIGNMYLEGEGAVYWSNDKPFVAVRETLWRIAGADGFNQYYGFVERVAQRINEYSTDPTTIDGYTVVIGHAWSTGSMDYINRFVDALDEDVVLVTVDQLIDLVSENVPHEDAVPDDIKPSDLDDVLVPISSEQYDWDMVKNTSVSDTREFIFSSQQIANSWKNGNGGLEYDSVKWVATDSGGESAIRLDGSDLEDVIDPLPNAWIYNMFELSADPDKDNYLYCYIAGGTNADVNLRVRALYEENGEVKSVILNSENYEEGRVNDYGWYKRTGASSESFKFDISALKGKKVLISIEQDDTGDGSGEIVFVRRVVFTGSEIVKQSMFPNWGRKDIRDDWTVSGSVESHSEGVCLEAAVQPSSISYTFTVTEETKWAKFYVRMFVRADDPDKEPRLQLTVNGTIVRALNAPGDTVVANSDYYRCIAYDLSDYVGSEITLTFTSVEGHHAAAGRIRLDPSCTTAEVTKLYSDNELKEMK